MGLEQDRKDIGLDSNGKGPPQPVEDMCEGGQIPHLKMFILLIKI